MTDEEKRANVYVRIETLEDSVEALEQRMQGWELRWRDALTVQRSNAQLVSDLTEEVGAMARLIDALWELVVPRVVPRNPSSN